MLYFPQVTSDATGQYPIRKRTIERTIVNQLLDGRTVKLADSGATLLEWQLAFQNLADAEIATLQQFFASCEGQLNAFTFTDSLGNLLAWSELLTQPSWQASTLLQLSSGIADPNGGTAATRIANPTSSDLAFEQAVSAPGWFTYCFSLYAKSQGTTNITLTRHAGTGSDSRSYALQTAWRRVSLGGGTNTTAESVTVGITIPAGQTVDVFGLQLEPQLAASPYKPSYSAGGVYSSAHFGQDVLTVTTTGPNRHQCTLTITAR
jgi:hypothetical protein